ncbi:MAG TPA: hypothetical protein VKQ72_11020, partial [Aggregatilineales bacterium]|nr:hypothetical protein [Aggregatilineales bacterium]
MRPLIAIWGLLAVGLLSLNLRASAQTTSAIGCTESALRAAIQAGGPIELRQNCTYRLSMNLPTISSDTVLHGNGATIDGGHLYRLLSTFGKLSLSVDHLTLQNGYYGEGAAIFLPEGDLVVSDCIFNGNHAIFGGGGAIWVKAGKLAIQGSSFSGNSAVWGGAVYADSGTVSIS